MAFRIIGLIPWILFISLSHCLEPTYEKKFLIPGKPFDASLNHIQKLCIYCYRGVPKHLFHAWQSAIIKINLEDNKYVLYQGSTPEDILDLFKNGKKSWIYHLFASKSKRIDLDPFSLNCIGIDTAYDHNVELNIIDFDFWRVLRFGIGVTMFLAAPILCANPIFYYICGILLGITTSVFIALYLISKLIPKKPTMYAVFIGGWAAALYFLQLLQNNIKVLAMTYYSYAIAYVIGTGLISFVVCYRFGPVTDPRSKNLIKWTMQIASLILIFYSSKCLEVSLLLDIGLLVLYNFSKKFLSLFQFFWRKTFPQGKALLTKNEYYEQGVRETRKALENLRQYCSSNECNQWKTMLSLRQPMRFAQFMEGSFHLEDSEILAYESKAAKNSSLLTDDSDSGEDI